MWWMVTSWGLGVVTEALSVALMLLDLMRQDMGKVVVENLEIEYVQIARLRRDRCVAVVCGDEVGNLFFIVSDYKFCSKISRNKLS